MAGLQLPNPPPSSPAVRNVMRANRARDTGPELRLRRALREAGLSGYRVNWKNAPGRPDIAYPGRKIAIFVHGCFWHHCPNCYPNVPKSNPEFWARKFALNRERDAYKRVSLENEGWFVVEAWECDVRDRIEVIVIEVAKRSLRRARPGLARDRAGSARSTSWSHRIRQGPARGRRRPCPWGGRG